MHGDECGRAILRPAPPPAASAVAVHMNPTGARHRQNAAGDLNRNFPFRWRRAPDTPARPLQPETRRPLVAIGRP